MSYVIFYRFKVVDVCANHLDPQNEFVKMLFKYPCKM